jgi:hypothetical protein
VAYPSISGISQSSSTTEYTASATTCQSRRCRRQPGRRDIPNFWSCLADGFAAGIVGEDYQRDRLPTRRIPDLSEKWPVGRRAFNQYAVGARRTPSSSRASSTDRAIAIS